MRILMTGSTGFIGSHLAKALYFSGQHDLVLVKRAHSDLSLIKQLNSKVRMYSLSESADNIYDIMEKEKPDIVIHLASLFLSKHNPSQIDGLIQSNITFPVKLLDAMASAGVKKIINTGTSWEHFNGSKDYDPVCLYAATKKALEDILLYYVNAKKFSALTLKLFDTYGPGDPRPKLFALLKKHLRESSTFVLSPGKQLLDLLYIEDVVGAYLSAVNYLSKKKTVMHEAFSIGSGRPRTLKEVVSTFEKVVGKKMNIEWGGQPYREREVMFSKADIAKAKEKLRWKPKYSLEQGIAKMISEEVI
ncbi:MAG: NAD(P)-dependent oxidoreductase [Candidatus Omnitrophota bacterium]